MSEQQFMDGIELARKGFITIIDRTSPLRTHAECKYFIKGVVHDYLITLSSEGDVCSCYWKSNMGVEAGPCKHIIGATWLMGMIQWVEILWKDRTRDAAVMVDMIYKKYVREAAKNRKNTNIRQVQ